MSVTQQVTARSQHKRSNDDTLKVEFIICTTDVNIASLIEDSQRLDRQHKQIQTGFQTVRKWQMRCISVVGTVSRLLPGQSRARIPAVGRDFCLLRYSRSWLRHCATSRKVAGSIPDGVITIFYWHNPSGRTMALRSIKPLTEMSTRNIFWGVKAAGA
jgi:hypothetical protein